ncbi:MAG: DUF4296 domain-containing protein, partial [Bacteroidota bacterium]|nr:DUF4296 domain-containing protein [Bacteroidota bacterium]
ILIVFFILLVGCNKNKTPDYVIPKDDFISILVDMHLLDGMVNESKVRKEILLNDTVNYYSQIFKNYDYTRSDFDTSIYYYSSNINVYDKIYKEVLNELNQMDTQLKIEEEEQRQLENRTKADARVLKEIKSHIGLFSCYPSYNNF